MLCLKDLTPAWHIEIKFQAYEEGHLPDVLVWMHGAKEWEEWQREKNVAKNYKW